MRWLIPYFDEKGSNDVGNKTVFGEHNVLYVDKKRQKNDLKEVGLNIVVGFSGSTSV